MSLIKKRVSKDWTWFEDYVYITATYTVFTPPGRSVQVGTGIFSFGEPRGKKVAITEKGSTVVIGPGSIHIRVYDAGGDMEVAVTRDTSTPIPILRGEF